MINKNTVFILGAGASNPYNYPVGANLSIQIYSRFQQEYEHYLNVRAALEDTSIEYYLRVERIPEFIQSFRDSCNYSGTSIDLFLSRNEEYRSIGKKAIVLSILNAEMNSRFHDESIDKDKKISSNWYRYLLEKMTGSSRTKDGYKNFGKNKVSFITFNYDRSLEYVLYENLKSSFKEASEEEIIGELSCIDIVHVYGQVAKLKWQDKKTGIDYLNGNPSDSYPLFNLDELSKNIRVIDEERNLDDIEKAKSLIRAAENIFFLGFGFAKENLRALNIANLIEENQKVFGTALKLYNEEIKEIKVRLFEGRSRHATKLTPNWKTTYIGLRNDCDCLDLLRHFLY